MRYRILGRLEVAQDGALVALGGFQQRALLAMLLVAHGRTVSVDRLVDELWAEQPPKTARHTVRVYASRLRRLIGEAGVETREGGYCLHVAPGGLDADRFERLVVDARASIGAGDIEAAGVIFREALGLWRGPALAEFQGISSIAGEAARLEEVRLSAEEDLVDVDLAQGASAALIPRLEELRRDHPRRERIAAQLMTALYRAGRQAEALAIYDDTRRSLDDLGLRPGESLRRLQRQILEHDSALARVSAQPSSVEAEPTRRPLRLWAVVAGLIAVITAAVAAEVASSAGSHATPSAHHTLSGPITLVLDGPAPSANTPPTDLEHTLAWDELTGLQSAGSTYHVRVRVAYGDFFANLAKAATHSSVVLVGPSVPVSRTAAVTRKHPHTTYVLLGGSIHDAAFGSNVVGMPFDDTEVGYLGGYLSALMAGHGHASAVAGIPTTEVRRIVHGFTAGVRAAAPGMRPKVTYSGNFINQADCEHIANQQISHGATVVFDIAGLCGIGAIDAAGVRGVQAVGIDTDLSSLGPQVIGSVIKRFDLAVEDVVQLASSHKLRPGTDIPLNLGNDGIDVIGISDQQVPPRIRAKLARVINTMRAHDEAANNASTP
jgi:DNA-binding SARP family transcriptional activator/basic membrane lipoprotein Med (substrate-binding protein (PBP1-ABC) superfamily)